MANSGNLDKAMLNFLSCYKGSMGTWSVKRLNLKLEAYSSPRFDNVLLLFSFSINGVKPKCIWLEENETFVVTCDSLIDSCNEF